MVMTRHKIAGTRVAVMRMCLVLIAGVVVSGVLLSPPTTSLVTATHDSIPVAVIDGTMKVSAGQTVYLDGNFSSDPGGGALSFRWTLESRPEGSVATVTDSTNANAQFDADVAGIYKVRLVVNNGFNDSEPVYATVMVTP